MDRGDLMAVAAIAALAVVGLLIFGDTSPEGKWKACFAEAQDIDDMPADEAVAFCDDRQVYWDMREASN